jgi:hypothetical protein
MSRLYAPETFLRYMIETTWFEDGCSIKEFNQEKEQSTYNKDEVSLL